MKYTEPEQTVGHTPDQMLCHEMHAFRYYRLERIEQLKQAQKQARFGSIEQITRADFVHQVTNAGEDVWVVVHLYKDKYVLQA